MPLVYEETEPLAIPDEMFNADGLAVLIAHGARYGGAWVINAFPSSRAESSLGVIETARDERPGMACDTALVWINGGAVKAGMKVVQYENLNDQFPDDQAPYFSLARITVAQEWVDIPAAVFA